MGDTRWCAGCGSEFQPGYTTCPDCGVALTVEPPALPGVSRPSRREGHEPVAYDLQDWPLANRDSLEWMLTGLEIPFEWDPPGALIVPESRANEVEGFIEYLDAGAGADVASAASDAGSGTDAGRVQPAVGDEVLDALGNDETATPVSASASASELGEPLRWLEPQFDQLGRAYLVDRSDHDPESAFEHALAATLDEESRVRLMSIFDGDEDDVYGAGTGERALRAIRDALERLAWTIPAPHPETTPHRSASSRWRPTR
jgi:hypothetical protein